MPTLSADDSPRSWAHQEREFEEHREDRARALFWAMRSGKSKAVIDKFDYQFDWGAIEGAILFAPNGVHINWVLNEIPRWGRDDVAFAWETPKRGDPAYQAKFKEFLHDKRMKWLCINQEALTHADCRAAVNRFLFATHRKFAVAVSEAHHFGRAGAARTQKLRALTHHAKFVTIETGTPLLAGPLKAYALLKILGGDAAIPGYEGKAYEKFVQHFAVITLDKRLPHSKRRKAFKKITSYQNLDELRGMLAPYASVVLRKDIGDMPELLRVDRPVVMSEKQRRAYLEMVNKFILDVEGGRVTAIDAGARVQKLQQIVNGYIKDEHGIHDIDPAAPIYEALVEQVDGTLPGKAIVWCRFREDIVRCADVLKRAGFKVLEFHGGVPVGKREPIRRHFQNAKPEERVVLVGNPGAGGEGRDFSEADAIIHFSSTPKAIHVEQGNERGTARGGRPTTIIRLRTLGTIDDRNWDIVEGRVTMADTVSGQGLRNLLMATDV